MSNYTLAEVKAAWADSDKNLSSEQIDRRSLGLSVLVRGIATRGAVTPDEFNLQMQLEPHEEDGLFSGFAAAGMDLDAAGNIVGAVLTTKPTPHAIAFGGTKLFAWCALDTLFLPGFLGEEAEIESTCPASQHSVRLQVAPAGVRTADPPEVVISVVLPGVGSAVARIGLASPT